MEKLELTPEQSTYAVGNDNSVISTSLTGGYSRSRVDVANSSAIVQCTWRLKDYEYQYFRAFFQSITYKGTAVFLIDLLLEQPYLEEYQAKFVPDSVEMANPEGLTYEVQAELEVIPIVDEEFNLALIGVYDVNGFQYLNDLDILVNEYIDSLS